jgi:hypothetical protein
MTYSFFGVFQHPDEVFQASLLHNLLSIVGLQSHVMNFVLPVVADIAYVARYVPLSLKYL